MKNIDQEQREKEGCKVKKAAAASKKAAKKTAPAAGTSSKKPAKKATPAVASITEVMLDLYLPPRLERAAKSLAKSYREVPSSPSTPPSSPKVLKSAQKKKAADVKRERPRFYFDSSSDD